MSSTTECASAAEPQAERATRFRSRWLEAARARERALRIDEARIVAALAGAASEWTAPLSGIRDGAAAKLSAVTGVHAGMLAAGLELVFGAVTEDSLRELLAREAGDRSRTGPESVFYALAGNVPGQGIPAIVASQLARSIAVVRDSERQPVVTAAFREGIARHEPDLAAMIVPVTWPGRAGDGDDDVERMVLTAAERVELFGSDATLAVLAARYGRASRAPIGLHGTRLSAGVVSTTADLDAAAERFALDVVLYEGRGCLTPHVLLVEGEHARTEDFAARLGRSLDALQRRWPRARGSAAEETVRRAFIDRAEAVALGGTAGVRMDPGGAWCVRIDPEASIALGPGLRCVAVSTASDRGATLRALSRAPSPLAAVGVAGVDGLGFAALERAFFPLGASLVTPAGRMQAPPIWWEQDGRRRLGALLEHS